MNQIEKQIKQRNKRELVALPTHVEPMKEETKRKIRKMFFVSIPARTPIPTNRQTKHYWIYLLTHN